MTPRIDIDLAPGEKKALFALLWAMARADGHIDQSEEGLLETIHQELFDQARFAALGRELARLRRSPHLDAVADEAARAIVREKLGRFEVP